jgi:hypothetical protein
MGYPSSHGERASRTRTDISRLTSLALMKALRKYKEGGSVLRIAEECYDVLVAEVPFRIPIRKVHLFLTPGPKVGGTCSTLAIASSRRGGRCEKLMRKRSGRM